MASLQADVVVGGGTVVTGAAVTRADLHISTSRDGELFVTSRQDGMIRMLVPEGGK